MLDGWTSNEAGGIDAKAQAVIDTELKAWAREALSAVQVWASWSHRKTNGLMCRLIDYVSKNVGASDVETINAWISGRKAWLSERLDARAGAIHTAYEQARPKWRRWIGGYGAAMTTLADRPNTALVVVDVQNGVMAGAPGRDEVVANINTLVARARADGAAVVWVQHADDNLVEGSEAWEYVPELERGDGEPLVHKQYGDSFEATDLEAVLADLGVGRLIVGGAQTDACIRSTLHGAFVRGYDVTLVTDAHTTEDLTEWGAPPPEQVIAHTNLYWRFQSAPGRTAGAVPTADVTFAG